MEKRVWIFEGSLLIALCITLLSAVWAQGRAEALSGKLVRLHVIAASDDEEEQRIKLQVRDAVLETLTPLLKDTHSQLDAQLLLSAQIDRISEAAAAQSEGRTVQVTLSRERYPERQYEGFSLPAGVYCSLRVILGEGQGKNWWCVVFPPLCTAAHSEDLVETLGRENYGIITEEDGYILRFRILELWTQLCEKWEQYKTVAEH